jgi:DNA-binding transcriptional regulator YdaS (Cro superfamily)
MHMARIVEQAVKAAGGAAELSRKLTAMGRKCSTQAISQWQRIPIERVAHVAEITGIPREKLRPDIFDTRKPQELRA